jgi:hypothetical protein
VTTKLDKGIFLGTGDNKFGQLGEIYKGDGIEPISSQVRDFSLGWNHTIILKGIFFYFNK